MLPDTSRLQFNRYQQGIELSSIAQTAASYLATLRDALAPVMRCRQEALRRAEEKGGILKRLMMFVALLSLAGTAWAQSARESSTDRLSNAGKVLHEIMAAPDSGIPEEVLDHARCVAVVPNMIKGGFIIGGRHGRGVASCRTAAGWSAPAFFSLAGGSWGLQIGVEGVDLVMIIQNEKGMQQLLASKFQIGADASVAAGPVGRHASANTNWKMETEILTYSRAKGVFAGLTLNGASIRRDDDSMRAIYGRNVSTRNVLLGKVSATPAAEPFLSAVRTSKAQAVAARD
jgi:lipid-binding SYLF domain-containing protein